MDRTMTKTTDTTSGDSQFDKFLIYPDEFGGMWMGTELVLYEIRTREQLNDNWDDMVTRIKRCAAPMGERIREFGVWKRMTWDFQNF